MLVLFNIKMYYFILKVYVLYSYFKQTNNFHKDARIKRVVVKYFYKLYDSRTVYWKFSFMRKSVTVFTIIIYNEVRFKVGKIYYDKQSGQKQMCVEIEISALIGIEIAIRNSVNGIACCLLVVHTLKWSPIYR